MVGSKVRYTKLMKRTWLYVIIAVLIGFILYDQWFRDTETMPEATPATSTATAVPVDEQSLGDEQGQTETIVDEPAIETVTAVGTYVGLRDEIGGDFTETASYLLLDDGSEIISISLESLVGTRKTGIESELGISRGDRIELTGYSNDGAFVPQSITVLD